MKKSKLKILLVLAIIVTACSSSKLLTPTQADADRMTDKYPDITLAQLTEGKSLYQSKCTACHPAKNPTKWTPQEWDKIVPGMVNKANKKQEKISESEKDLIMKYVQTACQAQG